MNDIHLPTWFHRIRLWWQRRVVAGVDHNKVHGQIVAEAGWSAEYALMTVLSAGVALIGLLTSSSAVLIGAMLISPLMLPITGLGFAIATLDFREIRRTGFTLAAGAVIAVALTALFVAFSPIQTITAEIAARTRPTLFDLLVAFLSALAGSYALIRRRGTTAVGVAIATALMPPLATVGFGLATGNFTVFAGALLLFFTNMVTIAMTAALVARLYGFGQHLSPSHTGWQLAGFVAALAALAIPLGSALKQIAFEAVARRQVRDTVTAQFPDQARLSQIDIDFDARPLRIRAIMMTPRTNPAADTTLAQVLGRRLRTPVDIHVDQVRTSIVAGQTEVAQIARASETTGLAGRSGNDDVAERLALIAGANRAAVRIDSARRVARAPAAPLPGLPLAGYRALEARAAATAPGWTIELIPPTIDPPEVDFVEGVADGAAIDAAAWASRRLGRALVVNGGTSARRAAVADGIVARGGTAETGSGRGTVTLAWEEPATE